AGCGHGVAPCRVGCWLGPLMVLGGRHRLAPGSATACWVSSGRSGGGRRSAPRTLVAGGGAGVCQPSDQHLEAGAEPLVAVVDPDLVAQGDQGRETFWGQGAEELVQLGPGGWVADAGLVDR